MAVKSLYLRLSALVLGIMLLTVWATISAISYSVKEQYSEITEETGRTQRSLDGAIFELARILSEISADAGVTEADVPAADLMDDFVSTAAGFAADRPERAEFLLLDGNLKPVFTTNPMLDHAAAELNSQGLLSITAVHEGEQAASLELVTNHFQQIRDPRGRAVAYLVSLPPPASSGDGGVFARRAWTKIALWLLAILVGGMALSALVIQWAVRPVDALTRAALSLNSGAVPAQLKAPNVSELRELFSAFNAATSTMERTAHLRKQMIADVAHELRTPVTNLRSQIEAFSAGLIADRESLVDTLENELGLLSRLVEDFQQLALSEAGQLPLRMMDLDLAELVTSLFTAHSRSTAMRVENNLDEPIWIRADPDRVQQILVNLLNNAERHRRDDLVVRLDPIENDSRLGIRFSDNGPGIEAGANEKIFERFYQGRISREQDAAGAGLGLTIARSLMTAMNGTIRAVPRQDVGLQGAQFDLLFTAGDQVV